LIIELTDSKHVKHIRRITQRRAYSYYGLTEVLHVLGCVYNYDSTSI